MARHPSCNRLELYLVTLVYQVFKEGILNLKPGPFLPRRPINTLNQTSLLSRFPFRRRDFEVPFTILLFF
jgi:hypothetical protein